MTSDDITPEQNAQAILANLAAGLTRVEEKRFSSDVEALIKNAERNRLQFMKRFRRREMLSSTLGLACVVLGGAGFGWFLLMEANIIRAVACMIVAAVISVVLHIWSEFPIKAYLEDHKENFMPQMAKALGGFRYYKARGISSKILPKTGIIPAYDRYEAEDCFMGTYKGVKVIFSEARLYMKKDPTPVFDGVFVLLEIPENIMEGHTIVTADKEMVQRYAATRWKKLHPVPATNVENSWDRFDVFSDKPDGASLFVGEKLMKELSEASDIFDSAPLSAVFFRGKYIFLSIPYAVDMFEASNIYVPVTTKKQAMTCKKEIQQILEIIDVFEIYQSDNSTP